MRSLAFVKRVHPRVSLYQVKFCQNVIGIREMLRVSCRPARQSEILFIGG